MSEPRTPGTTGTGAGADASTAQLITQATEQVGALVRAEMELARAELSESAKRAGLGAGLFGVAGVVALYGLGALFLTAGLALALVVDAWLAGLIVTVVLFAVAGVLALVGKGQVGRAAPPVQHSVESVQRDVAAVRQGSEQEGTTR